MDGWVAYQFGNQNLVFVPIRHTWGDANGQGPRYPQGSNRDNALARGRGGQR